MDWSRYNSQWNGEEVTFPDGSYPARVDSVKTITAKKSGKDYFTVAFRITSGAFTGSEKTKFYAMDNTYKWRELRDDAATCGLQAESAEEFGQRLEEMLDAEVTLVLSSEPGKDGKTYQTISVTPAMRKADSLGTTSEEPDIPF